MISKYSWQHTLDGSRDCLSRALLVNLNKNTLEINLICGQSIGLCVQTDRQTGTQKELNRLLLHVKYIRTKLLGPVIGYFQWSKGLKNRISILCLIYLQSTVLKNYCHLNTFITIPKFFIFVGGSYRVVVTPNFAIIHYLIDSCY